MLAEIERLQDESNASISQLGCAADLFGALVVPLAIELLANRRVKQSYVLDLKDPFLPFSRRAMRSAKTMIGLIQTEGADGSEVPLNAALNKQVQLTIVVVGFFATVQLLFVRVDSGSAPFARAVIRSRSH